MPVEIIIRVVFTVAVLIALLFILYRFREGKSQTAARDSLDIMKERYEKGEITKGDYEEAKRRRGKK